MSNKDDLTIVSGNNTDSLNISPVYDHIRLDKHTSTKKKKKQNIVIPKGKNKSQKKSK